MPQHRGGWGRPEGLVPLSRPPTRELPETCFPAPLVLHSLHPGALRPRAHTQALERPRSLAGMSPAAPCSQCASRPGLALKDSVPQLCTWVHRPACATRPQGGRFSGAAPSSVGLAVVLAPGAWSCGLSAPNPSRAGWTAAGGAMGQALSLLDRSRDTPEPPQLHIWH